MISIKLDPPYRLNGETWIPNMYTTKNLIKDRFISVGDTEEPIEFFSNLEKDYYGFGNLLGVVNYLVFKKSDSTQIIYTEKDDFMVISQEKQNYVTKIIQPINHDCNQNQEWAKQRCQNLDSLLIKIQDFFYKDFKRDEIKKTLEQILPLPIYDEIEYHFCSGNPPKLVLEVLVSNII